MLNVKKVLNFLESVSPPELQESYDNAGLIVGFPEATCTGVIVSLDTTLEVVDEAISAGANMIVSHHPVIFRGLKKISNRTDTERAIVKAIQNEISIYAIHTNLDNVINGVSGKMADLLGLKNSRVLDPKSSLLKKLEVFVPINAKENLLKALFDAGVGNIGNYAECSFSTEGMGSFKPNDLANQAIGEKGLRHYEPEVKIEVIFPEWLQKNVISAMKANHPYEEVAYYLHSLDNAFQETGSGIIGELELPEDTDIFLDRVQEKFGIPVIKHTKLIKNQIKKVALCGGAGSFLTGKAIASGADIFLTGDIKYHEFFDANGEIILADIGHYESEQFTIDLIVDKLRENFPNFAVLKTTVNTNPVLYKTR